ncbi:PBECR4 domain-containing protein [Peribacillus sp. NPDC096448]|uniref:PBECR4 domain-containing protein n=1 Tax=Peribacillus sp. NPDC096448 TaxID=3364395 RepID=UPI0037F7B387
MHNVTDLYNLSQKPLMGKISLELLMDYYEEYLRPFKVCYQLSDGNSIDLIFDRKRFAHLVGIETIAKTKYKGNRMLEGYRGEKAYKSIKKGQIDFAHLRNIGSRSVFNSMKNKWLFFYQLPHIILSPEAIFRYKKVSGSNIQCEILIYDLMHGVCAHLGIEKDSSGKFYIPRTFFIEKNNGLKFVQDQDDEITVNVIDKIDRSNNALVLTIDLKAIRTAAAQTEEGEALKTEEDEV